MPETWNDLQYFTKNWGANEKNGLNPKCTITHHKPLLGNNTVWRVSFIFPITLKALTFPNGAIVLYYQHNYTPLQNYFTKFSKHEPLLLFLSVINF